MNTDPINFTPTAADLARADADYQWWTEQFELWQRKYFDNGTVEASKVLDAVREGLRMASTYQQALRHPGTIIYRSQRFTVTP